MAYPQITEYHEAVQNPAQSFIDPDLKQGAVAENSLGLPLVMSPGFAKARCVSSRLRPLIVTIAPRSRKSSVTATAWSSRPPGSFRRSRI